MTTLQGVDRARSEEPREGHRWSYLRAASLATENLAFVHQGGFERPATTLWALEIAIAADAASPTTSRR